jgi:WD40 repeat protein
MNRNTFTLAIVVGIAGCSGLAFISAAGNPSPKDTILTDRYGDPLPKGAITRLGTVRFCQPLPVSIAFSPDGKILASGGHDNRIRFWDPDTGKELMSLEGHSGLVNCVAFSRDVAVLASGSQDKDICLWDTLSGKEKCRFQGHIGPVECLALSPDGKTLASSCLGESLRLWDTQTGKQISSTSVPESSNVGAMVFTPDSNQLALSGHVDPRIKLVGLADGKIVRTFEGHKDWVSGLALSSDGKTLYSTSWDGSLRVWDVSSSKELRRWDHPNVGIRCMALAPDEKSLAYGTDDGMVHIRDLASNKDRVTPWKAARCFVLSIAFSPDSKRVAVVSDSIAIHDALSGKRLNPPPEIEKGPPEAVVRQVEYALDGKLLVVERDDGTKEVWDTGKWHRSPTTEAKVGDLPPSGFSGGGKYLRATNAEPPPAFKGAPGFSFPPQHVNPFGLRPNFGPVFVLRDPATGMEQFRITTQVGAANWARLSPDGELLANLTAQNEVVLWETKTATPVRSFGPATHSIVFSPDGKTVATGHDISSAGTTKTDVVLWETATGRERLRIPIREADLRSLAYAPDGRLLASAGHTETIVVWDAWSGQEVARLTGHRGPINSLSFDPHGSALASGGVDSTVLIWDVSGLVPRNKPEKSGYREMAKCWVDLAGADAVRAYRVLDEMAQRPQQSEAFLNQQLANCWGDNAERLRRLLADLDDSDFQRRQSATDELANLGRTAERAMKKALENNPSLEAKNRIEALLEKMDDVAETDRLRFLGVVEVLERIGTPKAVRLLETIAKEAAEAEVVLESKKSLVRLAKREKASPP